MVVDSCPTVTGGQTTTSCLLPQTVSGSAMKTWRDGLSNYRDGDRLMSFVPLDGGLSDRWMPRSQCQDH